MTATHGEGKRQMDLSECTVLVMIPVTVGRNSKGVKR